MHKTFHSIACDFSLICLKTTLSLQRICDGLSHDNWSIFLFKIFAYSFVSPNIINYHLNNNAYYLKKTVHLFVKQNVYICSLKYYLHMYRNICMCAHI